MLPMLKRYSDVRVPVKTALVQLHDKEKDKKKKKKLKDLDFSDEDKEIIEELIAALRIVKTGSKRLCRNDITLREADGVRYFSSKSWLGVTELHLSLL